MYIAINLLCWGDIAHFVYHALNELMAILKIRLFHITYKKD